MEAPILRSHSTGAKPIWGQVVSRHAQTINRNRFDPTAYRFDPDRYIREKLQWEPWAGVDGHPGQVEILQCYANILRQMHEKREYEAGRLAESALTVWRPGERIKNWIRVQASHNVGKTRILSGIVNHFFDCFMPSITYAMAPSYPQIHDLLFKEIKSTREGKGLPGRVLDLRMERADEHFVVGRATSDSGGTGLEKIQGQHSRHMLLALDEAEGIEAFNYKAVDTMSSGAFCIVILLANPRTRTSEFHRRRDKPEVNNFCISSIYHPNVLHDREIVPGAVTREAVDRILDNPEYCVVVDQHDPDKHTFEVPWRPGVIFQPKQEALLELLGEPPDNTLERIFCPEGRYDEACRREPLDDDPTWARIGIDAARDGLDKGTIWVRHAGSVWRYGDRISHENSNQYGGRVKELCQDLAGKGVRNVQVRVDWGGGYGGGVGDRIEEDPDIKGLFVGEGKPEKEGWGFQIVPVHFGGTARDRKIYKNVVTELYAQAAESLKGLRLIDPPPELKTDLCERKWDWKNDRGKELKELEGKDHFRGRHGRSPDDGDGFVLCVAPDSLFTTEWSWA